MPSPLDPDGAAGQGIPQEVPHCEVDVEGQARTHEREGPCHDEAGTRPAGPEGRQVLGGPLALPVGASGFQRVGSSQEGFGHARQLRGLGSVHGPRAQEQEPLRRPGRELLQEVARAVQDGAEHLLRASLVEGGAGGGRAVDHVGEGPLRQPAGADIPAQRLEAGEMGVPGQEGLGIPAEEAELEVEAQAEPREVQGLQEPAPEEAGGPGDEQSRPAEGLPGRGGAMNRVLQVRLGEALHGRPPVVSRARVSAT